MLLLAIAALAFGLYAAHKFSAAPFVAANVVVSIAVVLFGIANEWSVGRVLTALVVTVVCLQAAFLVEIVRTGVSKNRAAAPDGLPVRTVLRRDGSTIDRTR